MTPGREKVAARPAPVDPDRRRLLGRVHVAAKALGMIEDDYRHLLERVTGTRSAADCDAGQLLKVMAEFDRLGFQSTAQAVPSRPVAASPVARKARAMWISLYQLGAIGNASEKALEAFAKRQLNVDRLQWASDRDGFRLIEALKAMGDRHGWDQAVPARLDLDGKLHLLKDRLVAAQIAKLDAADVPAGVRCDRSGWAVADLDAAIRQLAGPVRKAVAGSANG